MFETLLGHISKEEKKQIVKTLNTVPYAHLELKLIPLPVTYELVTPF